MSDTIESNGLETVPKVHLDEYKRDYMRARQRGVRNLTVKPAAHAKLKGYYDEYLITCQQNLFPTVEFNQFIMQYAEIGWLNCRSKIKGK